MPRSPKVKRHSPRPAPMLRPVSTADDPGLDLEVRLDQEGAVGDFLGALADLLLGRAKRRLEERGASAQVRGQDHGAGTQVRASGPLGDQKGQRPLH
jgi:hypothetical protein